jgi:hypothetical protein
VFTLLPQRDVSTSLRRLVHSLVEVFFCRRSMPIAVVSAGSPRGLPPNPKMGLS